MLHGIPLQVSLSCPHCHQPVHVQGMGEVEVCSACNNAVELPLEQWVSWFGPDEIAEALRLPDGEARQITSLGGASAKYAYGHRMPRCQACKTDLPADRLVQLARAGGHACGCGEHIRVRAAPEMARILVPGARWLVNEGATGSDASEPEPAAEPMMFQCMACSGALDVDGSERTVKCRFCGGSNYLPDGLWLRLHPPRTVRTFFVVLDPGEQADGVPIALLERLARSDDYDVRKSAAANPGLPVEVMERLVSDEDSDVRTALAGNPSLPAELLARMATDEDDDIREAVALNARTPLEVVVALARDDDWEVRRGAVRSGRLSDGQLAALAASESDSDVLEALEAADVGPETLRALAANDRYKARVVAASHAATPPDVLVQLASDSDRDVLKALVGNPALPGEAVLQLAQATGSVGSAARERPEYTEAVSARFRKRLLLGAGGLGILVCMGAGTGLLGVVAMAARFALRHL